MDVETVVKIEGYSVEYQEENDNGHAQSYEIKPAVSVTGLLVPGLCGFQNDDLTSPTSIVFHPENSSTSNCKRVKNSTELQVTKTKDVKGSSRRKEEASAKEKFKCSIPNCSKSFATQRKLTLHLKFDHRENWLKCHLCEIAFRIKSDLKSHLAAHSAAQRYVCNECSTPYKYSRDLRKHERKVHQITHKATQKSRSLEKQPPFQRSESAQIAMLTSTLMPILPKISHPFSFDAVPSDEVVISSKSSTEKSELVKHEPDPLTQPQILPGSSNKIGTEMADLTTTQKPLLVRSNPTNKCEICLKAFKSSRALIEHKSTTHAAENEKRFKCHICPKSFLSSLKLKQHLYFVHGEKIENLKILECEFCGRQYPFVARLEAHIVAKHVVDKEFECSVCSKTFVDQETLTKHQFKIHNQKTRNHFCHVCSARFNSKGNLVGHLKRVHKKIHCHKCGRSFENKSEFNQHLNSEATNNLKAELKFKCPVCSVSLSTQCNFNIHIDCHLGKEKSTVVTLNDIELITFQ